MKVRLVLLVAWSFAAVGFALLGIALLFLREADRGTDRPEFWLFVSFILVFLYGLFDLTRRLAGWTFTKVEEP